MTFAKLTASLSKAAGCTVEGLPKAIVWLLGTFLPQKCRNDLVAAGYGPT